MKQCIIFCFPFFFYQLCFSQNKISPSQYSISTNPLAEFTAPEPGNRESINTLYEVHAPSPYKTSLVKDGLVITAAAGITLLGYELIKNKRNLTNAELAAKTKDKLPFFDRGNAGYFSKQADKDSYILFDASMQYRF